MEGLGWGTNPNSKNWYLGTKSTKTPEDDRRQDFLSPPLIFAGQGECNPKQEDLLGLRLVNTPNYVLARYIHQAANYEKRMKENARKEELQCAESR